MTDLPNASHEPKICKNCKFYEAGTHTIYQNNVHWCLSPHKGVNVVTGEKIKTPAGYERSSLLSKHCGAEARFYEAKEDPPPTQKTTKARH